MSMVFKAAKPNLIKTDDGRDYPVSRIFCVGRNYAAHAREMGQDPDRDPPFFFTKWSETIVNAAPQDHAAIPYPPQTSNYHFEVELGVAIGMSGFEIAKKDALDHVWGYCTALDMTRRDLQLIAREKGRPWDLGKNSENSCPVGRLVPVDVCGHISSGSIQLTVDGELKQDADVSELIWSVPEIIADLSRAYTLRPGDLIITGTPAGVGPVVAGQKLVGKIAGLPSLEMSISEPGS